MNETTPVPASAEAAVAGKYDFMKYVRMMYTDPGHGWLAVDRKRIDELGLTLQISPFSYMETDILYLEEDADRMVYLEAEGLHTHEDYQGFWALVHNRHSNDRSWVRNLASYDQKRRQLQPSDVKLTLAKEPFNRSYIIGGEDGALARAVMKGDKPLSIDIGATSKTRTHLSMQCGEHRLGININFGDYKFAQKEKYTFLDHERYVASYFVMSKKQHIGTFEEYLKKLLAHLFRLMPRPELNVVIWDTRELRAFRANYPDTTGKSVIGKELTYPAEPGHNYIKQ